MAMEHAFRVFMTKLFTDFSIAFGVVIGASMLGGIAAIITLQPSTFAMRTISENIKIWAVVAAVGGTIDPFRVIESNIFNSQYSPAIQQILHFVSAFCGAHIGTKLIQWVCSGSVQS